MTTKPELIYQYECPECGSHRLDIMVTKFITVQFTSDDDHTIIEDDDSNEWDDNSSAECSNCGHKGKLGDMIP